MFLRKQTTTSIKNYSEQTEMLKMELETADAIVIGAGAGLSSASGLTYEGSRFTKYFGDFKNKYGISDMYSGGFYPFDTSEEYWAWWSRHIYINRYDAPVGKPYSALLEAVKDKDYFVITTNVDHQFQKVGFDKKRLFYTQGDYGLWQCSKSCHNKTYDNKKTVREMVNRQREMKIPSELIPQCPVCGAEMTMNLRCDHLFVQDDGWYTACRMYKNFIHQHQSLHILFLELGVGMNTPTIIKYPFWRMTAENQNAVYACINLTEAYCPTEIAAQSICLNSDIRTVLQHLQK